MVSEEWCKEKEWACVCKRALMQCRWPTGFALRPHAPSSSSVAAAVVAAALSTGVASPSVAAASPSGAPLPAKKSGERRRRQEQDTQFNTSTAPSLRPKRTTDKLANIASPGRQHHNITHSHARKGTPNPHAPHTMHPTHIHTQAHTRRHTQAHAGTASRLGGTYGRRHQRASPTTSRACPLHWTAHPCRRSRSCPSLHSGDRSSQHGYQQVSVSRSQQSRGTR